MKVAAIIAEYNPFHNGHKYHIEKTKELTGADYVIVVMSGEFTQRGIPAVYDKYVRTKMALEGGADLCLELPTIYSTSSAEYFAKGAVSILESLGIVDYLSFGSEYGNVENLLSIAKLLNNENSEFSYLVKDRISKGVSYPRAREYAIEKALGSDASNIIKEPNNILGVEYIKALLNLNSKIKPIAVMRELSKHNSQELNDGFCSSSAIRDRLFNEDYTELYKVVPEFVLQEKDNLKPLNVDDFSMVLFYRLIEQASVGFNQYFDVTNDLSDKIKKHILEFDDYSSFIDILKSKDITHSRISRALLHILLDIKDKDVSKPMYATILGFRKDSSNLLNQIKRYSSIPLISKNADYKSILMDNDIAIKMYEKDVFAYNLYQNTVHNKYHIAAENLFKKSPVII